VSYGFFEMVMKEGNITVQDSCGNIFADMGMGAPEAMLAKAQLLHAITSIIKHRHMSQVAAAELLRIDQVEVLGLESGRLGDFSFERLISFLNALDRDVEIRIKKKPRTRAAARFTVTA